MSKPFWKMRPGTPEYEAARAKYRAEHPRIPNLFHIFTTNNPPDSFSVETHSVVNDREWSYYFHNEPSKEFALLRCKAGLPSRLPGGVEIELLGDKVKVIGPYGTAMTLPLNQSIENLQKQYNRFARIENKLNREAMKQDNDRT